MLCVFASKFDPFFSYYKNKYNVSVLIFSFFYWPILSVSKTDSFFLKLAIFASKWCHYLKSDIITFNLLFLKTSVYKMVLCKKILLVAFPEQ